jgi:hypothetical protein
MCLSRSAFATCRPGGALPEPVSTFFFVSVLSPRFLSGTGSGLPLGGFLCAPRKTPPIVL